MVKGQLSQKITHFSHYPWWDTVTKTRSLKEKRVYLIHSFRSFSPYVVSHLQGRNDKIKRPGWKKHTLVMTFKKHREERNQEGRYAFQVMTVVSHPQPIPQTPNKLTLVAPWSNHSPKPNPLPEHEAWKGLSSSKP